MYTHTLNSTVKRNLPGLEIKTVISHNYAKPWFSYTPCAETHIHQAAAVVGLKAFCTHGDKLKR